MTNLGTKHENLDFKAYQIIKAMIIERRLQPGEKIPQEKLAGDLGISRTPVVNALKYLEHEKLIQALPRRGYFVRRFSQQEMIYIFELREVLEGLAARRASHHVGNDQKRKLKSFFRRFDTSVEITNFKAYAAEDRRFHGFVVEIGGKEFLKSILQTYNIIAFSYQLDAPGGLVRMPGETIEEHRNIIAAISRGDGVGAEELMRLHLRKSRELLEEKLASDSGSAKE